MCKSLGKFTTFCRCNLKNANSKQQHFTGKFDEGLHLIYTCFFVSGIFYQKSKQQYTNF